MELPGVLHDMPYHRLIKPSGGSIEGGVNETITRYAILRRQTHNHKGTHHQRVTWQPWRPATDVQLTSGCRIRLANEEDYHEPDEQDGAAANTFCLKRQAFLREEGERHPSKSRVECRRRSGR